MPRDTPVGTTTPEPRWPACGNSVADGQRAGPVSFRDAVECLLDDPGAFDDHRSLQADLLVTEIIDHHVVGRFERFGYHKDSWRYE